MATPDSTTPSPVRLSLQTDFDSPLPTPLLRELTDSALVVIEYAAMALRGASTFGEGAMALAMIRQLDADLDGALRIDMNQWLYGPVDLRGDLSGESVTPADRAAEVVNLVDRARARSRELTGAVTRVNPAARALVTSVVGDIDRARAFARELAANLAIADKKGEPSAVVSAPAYATALDLLLTRARAGTEDLALLIGDSGVVFDLSYRDQTFTVTADVERLAIGRTDDTTLETCTAVLQTLFGPHADDSPSDTQRRVEQATQLPAPLGPACHTALSAISSYAWLIKVIE